MPKRINQTQPVATGVKVNPVATIVIGISLAGAGALASHRLYPARPIPGTIVKQPVEQGLRLDFHGHPKLDKAEPFRSTVSHVTRHLRDHVVSIAHGAAAIAHHSRTSTSGHSSQD